MKLTKIQTKAGARQRAINWQKWQSEKVLSCAETLKWQRYFEKLAEKFDLKAEFKENGII